MPEIRPDFIISCGDLPFDYLEYLISRLNVPLFYVPGNHDPSLRLPDLSWMPIRPDILIPGPAGCDNIDGKVIEYRGLRIAGLGGSLRYKEGPHQYTQGQMGRRALALEARIRLKRVRNMRKLDILVTHAPPFGLAEAQDPAHVGFVAFLRLIKHFHPLLNIHGHVHPYGRRLPERPLNGTRIVNAIPHRIIET